MNTYKLSNISLVDFRKFLFAVGCSRTATYKRAKGRGGHEKWNKDGLARPIVVQTHIDPVPEFIVKNTLRDLQMTRDEFFKIIYSK
ncbi:MAG: type II toxin-antitoxin system HicA family toxin [Bacteroidaceae bacterium]|nr:type II toxin-antitoxin system HicA family toxin [Bacteroidaceae bacterium]